MAALSDDEKAFIVQALACYDTPSQVVESVNQEFGVSIPRQQVEKYDPTKMAGRGLSKKWRDLFESTREGWRKGATEVPIANRVFRLRVLDRLATKAERMRNMGLTLQVLEQAAKEVGDVYTRPRAVGGDAGDEPVPTRVVRGVRDARRHDDS